MLKYVSAAVLVLGLAIAPAVTPVMGETAAATDTETPKAKPKKKPSPAILAMRARQKQCGAEWKAAKKEGKVEKGMTWPKYWSACNKRLKAAAKK
jgi:hypothetical protein